MGLFLLTWFPLSPPLLLLWVYFCWALRERRATAYYIFFVSVRILKMCFVRESKTEKSHSLSEADEIFMFGVNVGKLYING